MASCEHRYTMTGPLHPDLFGGYTPTQHTVAAPRPLHTFLVTVATLEEAEGARVLGDIGEQFVPVPGGWRLQLAACDDIQACDLAEALVASRQVHAPAWWFVAIRARMLRREPAPSEVALWHALREDAE